jgi:hypothetical protein
MYYEHFRDEEEFNEIHKDLFLQKPIQNEDLSFLVIGVGISHTLDHGIMWDKIAEDQFI